MAMFINPTKEEIVSQMRAISRNLKLQIEKAERFELQMDRLTDAELEAIGFSSAGSSSEINWIRSQNTALKYPTQPTQGRTQCH